MASQFNVTHFWHICMFLHNTQSMDNGTSKYLAAQNMEMQAVSALPIFNTLNQLTLNEPLVTEVLTTHQMEQNIYRAVLLEFLLLYQSMSL